MNNRDKAIGFINFVLQGFGFDSWDDFKKSTFGFIAGSKILKYSILSAILPSLIQSTFGLNWAFLLAYSVLIIFEWGTGVLASFRKNEKHESKKLGRMLLKIAVYLLPIYILNQFQQHAHFPVIMGYEIDPFIWLYWTVIIGIIWQLVVSLLENLDVLGFRFAKALLAIINRKFYKQFELETDKI